MTPDEERFLAEIAGMSESETADKIELTKPEIDQIRQMAKVGLGPKDCCMILNAGRNKQPGKRKKPTITVNAFQTLMREFTPVREAFFEGKSIGNFAVSSSLYTEAVKGNVTAIRYYQETVSHRDDAIVNAAYLREQNSSVDSTNVILYMPDNGRGDSDVEAVPYEESEE